MKLIIAGAFLLLLAATGLGGDETGRRPYVLPELLDEALLNNPDIQTAIHEIGRSASAVRREGALDDPVLMYEREEMPGFDWSDPMMYRIGLFQTIRFPTKLGALDEIARIDADHAHHMHLETVNDVMMQVRIAYVDLWYAGESIRLNRESAELVRQFVDIANTGYRVGTRGQQDVLKAGVELARIENELRELSQEAGSANAYLIALLNRARADTIAAAGLPDEIAELLPLDSLESYALSNRPLILHDSLAIRQKELTRSLARDEYLPDLMLGVQYVNRVDMNRDAWTISAGITLPFAPWTLGKAGGRVEEAEADIRKSRSQLMGSRNLVLAAVRDSYLRAESAGDRLSAYSRSLLPQARQAFEATLIAYQTGREDFLALLDSHRTLIDLTGEMLLVRKEYESAVAALQRAVGMDRIYSREILN